MTKKWPFVKSSPSTRFQDLSNFKEDDKTYGYQQLNGETSISKLPIRSADLSLYLSKSELGENGGYELTEKQLFISIHSSG